MKFYKDRFGKWHKEEDFLKMAQIFCPGFPSDVFFLPAYLKDSGCIHEERNISNPSVIDYLKMGMKAEAICCYINSNNNIHIMDAIEIVGSVEKKMEAFRK